MPLYLRFLFPLIGLLLVTDLSLATHPGTTPHCPALDANDPVQREALMNHVCFLSAAPDTPAHRAESPVNCRPIFNGHPPGDTIWYSATPIRCTGFASMFGIPTIARSSGT